MDGDGLPGVRAAALENGKLIVDLETDAATAALVRHLVESGADVSEASRARETLESVFLKLVEEGEEPA